MRMSSLPCFGLCFSEKAPTHHGVPTQTGRTQSLSLSEMTFFVCAKGWISTKSSTSWFSSYHRTVFEEPFLRNDVTQIYGTVPTWNPTKYGVSPDWRSVGQYVCPAAGRRVLKIRCVFKGMISEKVQSMMIDGQNVRGSAIVLRQFED